MDCALPGLNGLQATRQILEESPETCVLMLSMHPEATWVRQAMRRAPADTSSKRHGPRLGSRDSEGGRGRNGFRSAGRAAIGIEGRAQWRLTQRELEVLQMIVDGKSNKEIAAALDLSANTVAVHRANIMNTLGIHKTAELVVYAIRTGLVNVP